MVSTSNLSRTKERIVTNGRKMLNIHDDNFSGFYMVGVRQFSNYDRGRRVSSVLHFGIYFEAYGLFME